jgi:hypothetical protein
MSEERKEARPPVTETSIKMGVNAIIADGLSEIRDELDRYFIQVNNETSGSYMELLSRVIKDANSLIERMLKIKF